MKAFLFIAIFCFLAFAPGAKTEFVLDDYYTIFHNSLIKQPSLYPKIFTSHLFESYNSSGYIKYQYYRPILEVSYILDYRLFKLNALGYQWFNWIIHLFNGWLVFVLILMLFRNRWLAFFTALIFVVLPSHEWVVRYITGRGDSLQTFFGLIGLVVFYRSLQTKNIWGYLIAFVAMILSILSREFGYLLPLYAALIMYIYFQKEILVIHFGLVWMTIGALSLVVTGGLLGKLGPIQSLHLWYFTSIGLCICIVSILLNFSSGKWISILLAFVLALMSFSQQPYWSSEEKLLRYTHALEKRSFTVAHQQLLMKYDVDQKAILEFIQQQDHPIIKSTWLWRLGQIEYNQRNLVKAGEYFEESIKHNPENLDALNARAVIFLEQGIDQEGFKLLQLAYRKKSSYVQTLQNLGIYYLSHNDPLKAQEFFNRVRFYQGY